MSYDPTWSFQVCEVLWSLVSHHGLLVTQFGAIDVGIGVERTHRVVDFVFVFNLVAITWSEASI